MYVPDPQNEENSPINNTKKNILTVSWETKLDKAYDGKTVVCKLQLKFENKGNPVFIDKYANVTMRLVKEKEPFINGEIKYY